MTKTGIFLFLATPGACAAQSYSGLQRYPEAEAQAAVGLDPADGVAHFLLGWLLARRPETRFLSENHLL